MIKKGDFIELDFTGIIKDEGTVFDTTKKEVAEKEHLHSHKEFKPIIICVGEGHVIPGLDKQLEGLEIGKHTIEVPAEEAFGKKSAKLLQLIPKKIFEKNGLKPVPGLEVNVDNQLGIIRSVSGGRVIVDFNHPLAGKDLIYEIEIKRKVESQEEQVHALLDLMKVPHGKITFKEGTVEVEEITELPPQFVDFFVKDVVRLTGVKDLLFKKKSEETKKQQKEEKKENNEQEKQ